MFSVEITVVAGHFVIIIERVLIALIPQEIVSFLKGVSEGTSRLSLESCRKKCVRNR